MASSVMVEKGPANPVPDPKSLIIFNGNAFRKPRTQASPNDYATPINMLETSAI